MIYMADTIAIAVMKPRNIGNCRNNGHVVGSDFECEMEEHLSIHEDRIY